jgi:predicted kinase
LLEGTLRLPKPRLVAIGGLSGTGKTTQALLLAPLLGKAPGAMVIRADVVRKRLLGVDLSVRLGPDGYNLQTTQRVYSALTAVAERTLRNGQAVVIDAIAARPEERAAFAAACKRAAAPFTGVWLQAPLALRAKRVVSRRGDPSDADAGVVHAEERWDVGPHSWRVLEAVEPPEVVHGAILAELLASEA